jgi:hypothetical protein
VLLEQGSKVPDPGEVAGGSGPPLSPTPQMLKWPVSIAVDDLTFDWLIMFDLEAFSPSGEKYRATMTGGILQPSAPGG